jgi:hypothetical protein
MCWNSCGALLLLRRDKHEISYLLTFYKTRHRKSYSREEVFPSPGLLATSFLERGHETGNVVAESVFCLCRSIFRRRMSYAKLMQRLRCHKVLYFLMIGVSLTVASGGLQAQQDSTSQTLAGLNVSAELQPTKSVFLEIDSCRVKIPQGELKQRFRQVEESLLAGLLIGWSPGWLKQSPEPHYVTLQSVLGEARRRKQSAVQPIASPQMYLKSLENDATVCRAAAGRRSEAKDSAKALEGVVDDLNLKFRDCYLHGMGRLVSMSVATNKDTAPDAGWTVYFKWVTVSNIQTIESAFPRTSTPATDDLPPGIYQLRAQKKDPTSGAMLESETKTVSLDGANSSCELQVP